jgi:3D (Asp-Asp-Asp) domain-containing protein
MRWPHSVAALAAAAAAALALAAPALAASAAWASVAGTSAGQVPAGLRPGDSVGGQRIARVLHLTATAYGPSRTDNYPYGPVDFFGRPLVPGDVAVDPAVVPLGTRLYVAGYRSASLPPGGEFAWARDEGDAIRGQRIDMFVDAGPQQVSAFGVQPVTVYVLQ